MWSDSDYFNPYVWIYFYLVFLTDWWVRRAISSLQLPIVASRIWNVYVKCAIAGEDFTAAAHTCLNYIDGFHRLLGEREYRAIMSHPQISGYEPYRAFVSPRYECSTRKLGLNARHGNFSTISRARLQDLRYAKRRSVPFGKIQPGYPNVKISALNAHRS